MGLNKVNYSADPASINKDQAGSTLGATWKGFQVTDNPGYDPSRPHFVVFKDGFVGIDFDIVTQEKILKEEAEIEKKIKEGKTKKNKYGWVAKALYAKIRDGLPVSDPWELIKAFLTHHGFPVGPDQCYIVRSGSGGFHYYILVKRPANFICQKGSNIVNFEHVSVDYQCGVFKFLPTINPDGTRAEGKEGGGGILYGVGTKWKDHPGTYTVFMGTEATIPEVDGWRVAWLLGRLKLVIPQKVAKDGTVKGFKIAEFLGNKIDVHLDAEAHEHEFIIWKESMFALKALGYTESEVDATFSRINAYDSKKSASQIKAWWDKENEAKRVPAVEPDSKKATKPPATPAPAETPAPEAPEPSASASAPEVDQHVITPVPGAVTPDGKPGIPPLNFWINGAWNKSPGLPIPDAIDRNASRLVIEIEPGVDFYVLEPTGIWHVRVFKKGTTRDRKIWKWRNFTMTAVLIEKNEDATVERYNFTINDATFRDCELDDVISKIYRGNSSATGEEKNIFGRFITEYVAAFKVPVIEYAPVLGFTANGWRMIDKYWIAFKGAVHLSWRPSAEAMCRMVVEETKAKEMARAMYDAVKIAYEDDELKVNIKDILFALNTAAPFMSALQPFSELMPMIALGSYEGEKGKTAILKLLTTQWYGFPVIISPNMFKTTSRAEDYISFSTFPVGIDDITKLSSDHKAMLKSALTTQAYVQKKEANNKTFVINKPLSSPPYIAYNELPDLLDDDKILSRLLIIPITSVYSDEDKAKFDSLKGIMIPGYLGRFIYEKTKDFSFENVLARYKLAPMMPQEGDGSGAIRTQRENSIYKLAYLGAALFKEIFGIELNLTGLDKLIKRTLKQGSEDVFGIMFGFLEGCMLDKKDRPKWVMSELYEQNGEYRFNSNNLVDINNRIKGLSINTGQLSLQGFASILKKRWSGVEYAKACWFGDHTTTGIIIPKADINEKAIKLPPGVKALVPDVTLHQDDDLIASILTVIELQSPTKDELKAVLRTKHDNLSDKKYDAVLQRLVHEKMIDIEKQGDNEIIKFK